MKTFKLHSENSIICNTDNFDVFLRAFERSYKNYTANGGEYFWEDLQLNFDGIELPLSDFIVALKLVAHEKKLGLEINVNDYVGLPMSSTWEQFREDVLSEDVVKHCYDMLNNFLEPATKVIFRYWNGDVIALFPELPGDMNPETCMSYMHVGQHSAADYGHIIDQTKPAKPEQYAELAQELESIGYKLEIKKRANWQTHAKRYNTLKETK